MVKVRLKGQSFMLHQIRLMIGSAMMVALGVMPSLAMDIALIAPYFIGKMVKIFFLKSKLKDKS